MFPKDPVNYLYMFLVVVLLVAHMLHEKPDVQFITQ